MTGELDRWFGYGAGLVGSLTGAAVGSAATGEASMAVLGAGVGAVVEGALAEAGHRFTSVRQRARIGATLRLARDALLDHIAAGHPLRTDAFLRSRIDGRSPADEVVEHVILVAQRTYEERKLPFIAAALANIAVSPSLNEISAHWILTMLEDLSWPKLVAIAVVGAKAPPLPTDPLDGAKPAWSSWSAQNVFRTLYYEDQLLGTSRNEDDPRSAFESLDPILDRLVLTIGSTLLYEAADLNKIPLSDREALIEQLRDSSSPPPESTPEQSL